MRNAMNIVVQMFYVNMFSFLLGNYVKVELLGHELAGV